MISKLLSETRSVASEDVVEDCAHYISQRSLLSLGRNLPGMSTGNVKVFLPLREITDIWNDHIIGLF